MSPQFLVIAYYTQDSTYQTLAEKLKSSTQNFGLPLHLEAIRDQGSWEKNTHYKAHFIKKCLNGFKSNLLYVDVDAIFRQYPSLIDTLDCDIAYRTQDFKWRRDEALSGTIFLRNNEKTKNFVDHWIDVNRRVPAERMNPETWEQKHMQTAQRSMPELQYYNLPPEYTFIFDHTRKMYPGLHPIIEHFQESRYINRKKR
jgi:hypothetical protein